LERAPLPEALAWLRAAGAGDRVLLVTLHRRENWGPAMAGICRAVRRVVDETPDVQVVFPMHRNPIVRQVVVPALGNHPRIHLIEPLDYVSFLYAQYRSHFLVTDSGGVQEEAPAFGKPVLVLRETTERPEGVAAGVARLVGTAEPAVYRAVRELLDDRAVYDRMAHAVSPYGDGHAAERIVDTLIARIAPRQQAVGAGKRPLRRTSPRATAARRPRAR
jgi:UDP-N-acetylglucosamine 2-epimerase (non-hydrolysing)